MLHVKHFWDICLSTIFAILLLPILASTSVNAADRVVIDEWDTNNAFSPMYARVMDNGISEYVPIVFYRDPNCVIPPVPFPTLPEFDLLTPGGMQIPGAFFCLPLTIQGFAIFEAAANIPLGVPPFQAKSSGDAVPFVLVERSAYDDIAADGLYIDEFDASMWATATSYKEVLQPIPAANTGLLDIVAKGTLDETGALFNFRLTAQFFWIVDEDGIPVGVEIAERVFRLNID